MPTQDSGLTIINGSHLWFRPDNHQWLPFVIQAWQSSLAPICDSGLTIINGSHLWFWPDYHHWLPFVIQAWLSSMAPICDSGLTIIIGSHSWFRPDHHQWHPFVILAWLSSMAPICDSGLTIISGLSGIPAQFPSVVLACDFGFIAYQGRWSDCHQYIMSQRKVKITVVSCSRRWWMRDQQDIQERIFSEAFSLLICQRHPPLSILEYLKCTLPQCRTSTWTYVKRHSPRACPLQGNNNESYTELQHGYFYITNIIISIQIWKDCCLCCAYGWMY